MEFLLRGVLQFDEPGVFMAFEETSEELIQNVRSLREAERDYLDTVSGYDKAQLRLLLLLGPSAPPPAGAAPCH